MCLFVNILSFDTCVILEQDERESKNSKNSQKIVENAKALDFQRVFQVKSHRISTSAAEVCSALIEIISRISDSSMFEEKANPEISWQSFKISKNRIENVDVTLGLGPLASRLTGLFVRPVPDQFDGNNLFYEF